MPAVSSSRTHDSIRFTGLSMGAFLIVRLSPEAKVRAVKVAPGAVTPPRIVSSAAPMFQTTSLSVRWRTLLTPRSLSGPELVEVVCHALLALVGGRIWFGLYRTLYTHQDRPEVVHELLYLGPCRFDTASVTLLPYRRGSALPILQAYTRERLSELVTRDCIADSVSPFLLLGDSLSNRISLGIENAFLVIRVCYSCSVDLFAYPCLCVFYQTFSRLNKGAPPYKRAYVERGEIPRMLRTV